MNAHELADELLRDNTQLTVKAAYMLRQQADRIAELEKQGKPVAWMQMHYKDNIPTKFSPVKVWEDDIPLYTTPQTKPLSDEEHYKNKAEYLDKRELELLTKIRKYEQVLQSIANEQVELSHDKIKWQCEDHIRWAKEALK